MRQSEERVDYPGTWLKALSKSAKHLSYDIPCFSQDSNREAPDS
jgi:hypothetical protein